MAAKVSPNVTLALAIGMNEQFAPLVTTRQDELARIDGWSPWRPRTIFGRSLGPELPFAFFPLAATDSPLVYGVRVDGLAPLTGRLCVYSPEEGAYHSDAGRSGIWLMMDAIEVVKIAVHRLSAEDALDALVAFAARIAGGSRPGMGAAVDAMHWYRQSEPTADARTWPWFSDVAVAEDPPNLDAAGAAARAASANLGIVPNGAPVDADALWKRYANARGQLAMPSDQRKRSIANAPHVVAAALHARSGW